jgi:hypothetical protein
LLIPEKHDEQGRGVHCGALQYTPRSCLWCVAVVFMALIIELEIDSIMRSIAFIIKVTKVAV